MNKDGCAEHVARKEETRNSYRVLVFKAGPLEIVA
jgi:hypothetical protein